MVSLKTGALAMGILLAALAPAGAAEIGTATSGQSNNFDAPNRGFVRIIGTFNSAAALSLGAASITASLDSLLNEDGHGELVSGLPVTLFPRTRSARVTVFETPAGATPFYRLTVRTCVPALQTCPTAGGLDVGEYEFRIEGVNATVARPTECGAPPGPGSTNNTSRFTINDGINPPVEVILDEPWTCTFQKGRVTIIRIP
jgi:hypothetical protein